MEVTEPRFYSHPLRRPLVRYLYIFSRFELGLYFHRSTERPHEEHTLKDQAQGML
jgi:hypothetical protein